MQQGRARSIAGTRLGRAAVLLAGLVLLPTGQSPAQEAKGSAPRPAAQSAGDVLPPLSIAPDVAARVGRQVFINETGGVRSGITTWNAHEDFASVGIGHFIWFPAGRKIPFAESFPPMLQYLSRNGAKLPAWLDRTPVPPCPWPDKATFQREFNSPRMTELRQFLLDTVGLQTQYLVERMQGALPKMLASVESDAGREHVRRQFVRVARASRDLYPLIDYINFKGEGTNPDETAFDAASGRREGWGLRHVLAEMKGTSTEPGAVLAEFADAAARVLKRRIRNIPANAVWEAGWMKRVATYRRGLETQRR